MASSSSSAAKVATVQKPAPQFKAQALVNGDFKEVSLDDFKGVCFCCLFSVSSQLADRRPLQLQTATLSCSSTRWTSPLSAPQS